MIRFQVLKLNNDLLLLSKSDIPFIEAQVNIHQPTIKEISLISEESFWNGCYFLNFSLNNVSAEDKMRLGNKSEFEVFMSMINSKENKKMINNIFFVLTLLFPTCKVDIQKDKILLIQENGFQSSINKFNFESFKDILISMFILNEKPDGGTDYNPADGLAKKIAEKLKKAQQKLAKQKGQNTEKISILNRYVSILAVGEQKDINELMEYSVYQIKDEFKRFQLKVQHDHYFSAKLAGAQDLEEVENWMGDIHSDSKN